MEPFKDIYNKKSINSLSKLIKSKDESFDHSNFSKFILKELESLEMKDRVKIIAKELHKHNNGNYKKNIKLFIKCLAPSEEHLDNEWDNQKIENGLSGFLVWPISQYIETYGIEDFETSMDAIYEITQRFTGEFAIRPFIEKYPKESVKRLEKWKRDKCHHVRRLVSEGTRPHLPWGIKVQHIINNPTIYLSLLTDLYDDESEYVRRSVANHMNDLSKIQDKLFFKTVNNWNKNKSRETEKLIRHASRTLLKKGDPRALRLHGYNPNIKIEIKKFKVAPRKIKEGDTLNLSLELASHFSKKQAVIIEYIVHYLKKNGEHSEKVFRFKDTVLNPFETISIEKKVHFKKVTTRKHYPGKHFIEIQINGTRYEKKIFQLEVN